MSDDLEPRPAGESLRRGKVRRTPADIEWLDRPFDWEADYLEAVEERQAKERARRRHPCIPEEYPRVVSHQERWDGSPR